MSTFYCKFDLVLYPFDEQSCGMEFQILNAPKSFLMFDKNKTSAENIDSNMLLEYQVSCSKIIFQLFDKSKSVSEYIIVICSLSKIKVLKIY